MSENIFESNALNDLMQDIEEGNVGIATKCNGCTLSAHCGRFLIRWSLKKSE